MRIRWTKEALTDLVRLRDFVAPSDPKAASRIVEDLSSAPRRLLRDHPRISQRIDVERDREVRRLIVRSYVIHYEIAGEIIYARVWHAREDR